MLSFRAFHGAEIAPVVEDFARLRIAVFRDWPYLYDGDLDYERRYMAGYTRGRTILAAAYDGDRLVGGATGLPLTEHAEAMADLRGALGVDLNDVYYCAESVLFSAYRGQGAYRRFFALREDHARSLGLRHVTFCGVIRPDDHPARPPGAGRLDPVWRRYGYAPLPGVVAHMRWRDIGDAEQTAKPLQFWMKTL